MHAIQAENSEGAATAVDPSDLSLKMITDPHFRALRALFDSTIAHLAEASGLSGSPILNADRADVMANMKANNVSKLQRMVETAAMVSIDGDAAIGAAPWRRQP